MITSGEIAKATVSDAAVELLPATPGLTFRHFMIINEGVEPGFWQIGDGAFVRIPGASFEALDEGDIQIANQAVNIKRVAGGSNMTGVYGVAW